MSAELPTMTTIEQWRPVPGFQGYEVSSAGIVRSSQREIIRPRKLKVSKGGYLRVGLHVAGRKQPIYRLVHRLVLMAFVGDPPPGHECDHKNGVRSDNRLENLEWVDRSTNQQRVTVRHGGRPWVRGERNNCSVLTRRIVRIARHAKRIDPSLELKAFAEAIEVPYKTLWMAVAGRTWQHA